MGLIQVHIPQLPHPKSSRETKPFHGFLSETPSKNEVQVKVQAMCYIVADVSQKVGVIVPIAQGQNVHCLSQS